MAFVGGGAPGCPAGAGGKTTPLGGQAMSERIDVPVAGGALAVFRLGSPSAPARPVVALHGITSNSQAWVAVARALGADVPVLALDLRGRGDSRGLPGPYGLDVHVADVLAVLDHFGLERAVLAGHSLGAFVATRVAAEHPERVESLVLVDGGLAAPVPPDVDRQALVEAGLGPALARLKLSFESREAYVDWWREHPAFRGSDIGDGDLAAFARHDLIGGPPDLHPSVVEAAVRGDAEGVFEMGRAAHRLTVPATLLRAPRGLMNEPRAFQPPELAAAWVDDRPEQRRVVDVPDVNHYSLLMGARGAAAVAGEIRAAVTGPGNRSAGGIAPMASGHTGSP
jgi:pimeloyl-ACP methyl ester carboxylesterase